MVLYSYIGNLYQNKVLVYFQRRLYQDMGKNASKYDHAIKLAGLCTRDSGLDRLNEVCSAP